MQKFSSLVITRNWWKGGIYKNIHHSISFEIFESRKSRDSNSSPFGPGNQDLSQKKNWSWSDGLNKRLEDPVRLTVMKTAAEICYARLHLRMHKYTISILVRPVIRANKINSMQKLTPMWILEGSLYKFNSHVYSWIWRIRNVYTGQLLTSEFDLSETTLAQNVAFTKDEKPNKDFQRNKTEFEKNEISFRD